jgi:glutaredoxin 3
MQDVIIYSKDHCPYCTMAKTLLEKLGIKYKELKIGVDVTREQLLEVVPQARTAPQIVINGQAIGGYDQLADYIENNNYNGTGHTI